MKRFFAIVLVMLVLISGLSLSASAEPTDSFTHIYRENGTIDTVMTREMYKSTKVITASSLGLENSLKGLNDLCFDGNGNVYLLTSDRSAVVVLNPDFTYQRTIELTDSEGSKVSFTGAKGIYVYKDTTLYICDTNGSQVIVSDMNGLVTNTLLLPESNLIPEDFIFLPTRIVRDEKGYTYILSESSYYGALAYSPEYEFLGFYGANTVEASALDTLSFLWDKLTQTDEKKEASAKELPTAFVDITLDNDGYIVTCTGKAPDTDGNGTGQLRKLSPGGADILYQRAIDGSSAASTSLNFLEEKVLKKNGSDLIQNFVSVDTDEDNFIYALDQTYGLIYIYDNECNMLCGFGGGATGSVQQGVFANAVSLKVYGDNLLVADYKNSCVTVFEITEYGKALMQAQALYLKGDYDKADKLWNTVLSYDSGNQLAYRGLAMSALTAEDYDTALVYAEEGLDYTVYDMAWQNVISKRINDNFIFIFPIAILLLGGLVAFLIIKKKRQLVLITNANVKMAFRSVVHPFDSFGEMSYKGNGSVLIASIILLLFYISKMLESTASGFLFTTSSPDNYNMIYTVISTVGIVVMWSVANWLVACLASGKGRLKEVYIATCYILIPLVLFTFLKIILSHFLPLSGLALMNGIGTAVLIYTFFLLSIAIMAIHEYDFFKFLTTAIVSVLLIILIIFVVFLVVILLQQIGEFFSSLYMEMFYR